MILGLLQQLRTKQWIGFFCVVSAAKRNWRRLFIVIWADAVCRSHGQTATNFRWSRYRSNYIITKVIIPDRLKTSELVVKLQINLVTSHWNGPVSYGLLRNHSPDDSQGLRQNKFLSYPWKSHRGITATGRQGKNSCYSNTRSQSTSALCLLHSYKEGGYKNNPRKLYSLGTGLSGSSDSRTSWCRQ